MRIVPRILVFLFLPALLLAGTAQQVVFDQANLNSQPIVKLQSTAYETELGFRMAGAEISDGVISDGVPYKTITPLSSAPEKFGAMGDEGYPDLPLYAQLVAIPDQAGVQVEILSSTYQIIDDIDISPDQPSQIEGENQEIPFVKSSEAYSKDEFYPANIVEVGEPLICRDLRMVQTVVYPFQYNPVTRQLKVYTNIDYRLTYQGTDNRNVKIRRNYNIAESFVPIYQALVPNADEMLADYQPVRGGYLIITPTAFADTMQALARWKHLKGYTTVVTRATDIDPDGSLSAAQIYTYIQNAYNTWENPPEFICIAGDENMQIVDYPYGSYASDHDYSCVDGSDYFSDIMVTRMSFPSTSSIASVTMRKALRYEKDPPMTDSAYWLRGLSVAGNVYASTPRLTTLWVRNQLFRHGFTRVDTSFVWSSGPVDPLLPGYFNNGVSIVSYRGWAGPSGWYAPSFSTSDLEALTSNNKIGVMASLVCGTGDFSSSECFGEKWIRMGTLPNSLKGGPGFYGITDPSTHTKWNNPVMIGYYWAILEEGIYNFASAAFMGKMELYNTYPRHNYPGSYVEQYFHTYNTLGEPEFEVRTAIPQTMTVTYPATLPVGASFMAVHVTGTGGLALANAYVTLVKGYNTGEEVFVNGKTNSNGDINFDFSTTTADTMFVTAFKKDYIPHNGYTLVQSQAVAVNTSAVDIDDDGSGNSSGNNDGNANPAETLELGVTLRNFGTSTTATNVQATLTSPDPAINITTSSQSYGSIAPGATAVSGSFVAVLAGNIPQGEHYILQLNITSDQGNWSGSVPLDIKNMKFSSGAVTYPGNSNSRLDPGETSQLVISIQNLGELAGLGITGLLTTADTSITILDASGTFGDIAIGGSGSNSGSPFTLSVSSLTYAGRNVNFNLQLTSSSGAIAMRTFSVVVGNVNTYDPVGPDNYGYYMYDNTDGGYLNCPIYNWVEINPNSGGAGTRITFPFSTDDDAVVVTLPFNFVYYGQAHSYMLVGINGFVAFDTTRFDMQGHHWFAFDNNQLPEAGAPAGLIAPFWDDLEYTGNNGVFRYYDTTNHRFIIEWSNCTHPQSPGNSPETFQMIINDPAFYPTPTGDCEFIYQYNVVNNNDTDTWDTEAPGLYSTVGLQNMSNNDGLQYTYDNLYHPAAATLAAGRAIKITTSTGMQEPPDIAYDPSSFVISAVPGQTIIDTLTISNVSGGLLAFTLNEFADNRLANADRQNGNTQSQAEPVRYFDDPFAKTDDQHQPLYPPVIANNGGPDIYGYNWIDSDDPGGPIYGWVDISGVGTPVTFSSDDGGLGPFNMGLNFSFYDNTYNTIYIGANGILTFGGGTTSYSNVAIPNNTAPNNFIAPLWDDLSPQRHGSYYYYHDTINNRFIISFFNCEFYTGGGDVNFEVILYPDGRIVVMYGVLDGGTRGLNSCSVGIENSDGTDGLQVVYNGDYLHSSMAILYYPPSRWLSCSPRSGNITAGNHVDAIITFDASELGSGLYSGHLDLDSNDPDEGSINIPVTFNVGSVGVPNISYSRTSLGDTLNEDEIVIHNLIVRNTGNANLIVNLSATEFNLAKNDGSVEQPADAMNTWLFISPAIDTLLPGDTIIAPITLDARFINGGNYAGRINLLSNDPDESAVSIPVALLVNSVGIPNISYSRTSLSDTLSEGETIDYNLIVRNVGSANLMVNLSATEFNLAKNDDSVELPADIMNTWLFIAPAADTLLPGDTMISVISLDARFIGGGTYNGRIDLVSNDPDTPDAQIPATLLVTTVGPGCHFVPGDINNNGAFNGIDITFGVTYFKGGTPPPYSCLCGGSTWFVAGDINGNCTFNGIDITYGVAYFKGGAAPIACPQCPPTLIGKLGKSGQEVTQ